VIFGTDFPVLDFSRTVDEIEALNFTEEIRDKFLRANALRIYGLPN
jgi:predicted TIM-barrel fold metal-dependent hydrolase